MEEIADFGLVVVLVSGALLAAILARSVTDRFALPGAALLLVASAVAAQLFPGLADAVSIREVERIAVVALVVILFDGGLHIGMRRFRGAAAPILATGVLGTFVTAGLLAAVAHYALDFGWTTAGLIGAALAPTDPAVTFAVFGNREVRGRSGTILKGESGANDPVGIALMLGLIEFATEEDGSFWIVVREFALEMSVGIAVGIAAAGVLLPVFRRVPVSQPTLYPLRVLAAAGMVYGVASLVHGSGFIAVFVAGILLGDAAMPRKGDIESFHSSLASLAEIAVFIALGLSIDLDLLENGEIWVDGIVLFLGMALVIRPLAVGPLLLPARLRWGERLFTVWGGLKGAVPILLAALVVLNEVQENDTIYAIVFVVVLLSVLIQGTSMPWVAERLQVPFRRTDWQLAEVRPFIVGETALADGTPLNRLPLGERAWVGAVVRDGSMLRVTDRLRLAAGDRVDVYCEPRDEPALRRIFEGADG